MKLTVPKVITACLALALGVNGVIEVGLGHDMAGKTARLRTQVQTAQTLSQKMKTSVSGLSQLESTTQAIQGKLTAVQATTSDMNHGLGTLYTSVQGIDAAVSGISQSTAASETAVKQTTSTLEGLLATMTKLSQTNGKIIANLSAMKVSQSQINRHLQSMNQKTSSLP